MCGEKQLKNKCIRHVHNSALLQTLVIGGEMVKRLAGANSDKPQKQQNME
jgi:hypothetical protein